MDVRSGAKLEPCVSTEVHEIEISMNEEEEEHRIQDTDQENDVVNPELEWKTMMQQFLRCQQSTMELLTLQLQSKQVNSWGNFTVCKEGDDVNTSLTLFESVCKLHQVPEQNYIRILWSHTHGNIARLLQQMPYEELNDYQKS